MPPNKTSRAVVFIFLLWMSPIGGKEALSKLCLQRNEVAKTCKRQFDDNMVSFYIAYVWVKMPPNERNDVESQTKLIFRARAVESTHIFLVRSTLHSLPFSFSFTQFTSHNSTIQTMPPRFVVPAAPKCPRCTKSVYSVG